MFKDLPYEISEQIILQICNLNITNKFCPDRIKKVYYEEIHNMDFLFEDLNILKTLLIQNLILDKDELIKNALRNHNFPVLELLIEIDCFDPRAQNDEDFRYAAFRNDFEMVKFLVEQGCDPTVQNNQAIIDATQNNNLEFVKFLIDHGCDPTAQDNKAIRRATAIGNFKMVKFLLDKGCDKDRAILYAIQDNNQELVKFLSNL